MVLSNKKNWTLHDDDRWSFKVIGSEHTRKLSQSSIEKYVPSFGLSPRLEPMASKRRTRHKLRPETSLKTNRDAGGGLEFWNRSQYPHFADDAFKQKLNVAKNFKNQSSVMSDVLGHPNNLKKGNNSDTIRSENPDNSRKKQTNSSPTNKVPSEKNDKSQKSHKGVQFEGHKSSAKVTKSIGVQVHND